MSTYITTKTFHEVKKNGKTIEKKMLNATYDGKNAIIDTYENNIAHRFELSHNDIKNLMNNLMNSSKKLNLKYLNGNSSIKEHLLSLDNKSSLNSKSTTLSKNKNSINKNGVKKNSANSTRGKGVKNKRRRPSAATRSKNRSKK